MNKADTDITRMIDQRKGDALEKISAAVNVNRSGGIHDHVKFAVGQFEHGRDPGCL